MKKFLSLALAAVIAISANAQKVETQVINSVSVNAPVRLVIIPSRQSSVKVASKNPEMTSAISWEVKDGVLNITARDLESLERSDETVDVIVMAPGAVDYTIGEDMEQVSSSIKRMRPPFGGLHRSRPFFRR
ncbi:MAG: hypothetical protein GXY64_07450 [Bacteroidales bacterium]|nr:hypothetical protein [Bacteroidales bacterium]